MSHIDEYCDWDSIYFEISYSKNEPICNLFDKKKLAMMLSKDEFFDWKSALSCVDPLLLDYIKNSIKIDKKTGELILQNQENIEKKICLKYKQTIGGIFLERNDMELTADEQKYIVR